MNTEKIKRFCEGAQERNHYWRRLWIHWRSVWEKEVRC